MSTDYRIYGFTAPSEKFLAYKAIRDNCLIADIEVPEKVEEFFGNYSDYLFEQGYGERIELTPPSMMDYNCNLKEMDGVIAENKEGSYQVTLDLEKLSELKLKYIVFGAYY